MHRSSFSSPATFAGFFILAGLCLLAGTANAATEVLKIRTGVEAARTRIVFDLSSSEFEYSRHDETDRSLTLLLSGAVPAADLSRELRQTGRLDHATISKDSDSGMVVRFQLLTASRIKTFVLDGPPRLVVDFKPLDKNASTDEAAADKVAADKAAADKAAADKAAADKAAADKAAADKAAADKIAADKATADKATADKIAADKAAADKATADKATADKVAADKATADKAAADKVAADKVAADKVAADKVTADKVTADKATADKAAADKVAADKATADKAAAIKVAADKAAITTIPRDRVIGSTPGPTRSGPRIVVIDAGHGGKDPGAVGDGVREKDVCLDVARSLHKELSARKGYHPILARTQDIAIPLRERMQLAEEAEADLFVSIHVNSADTPKAQGVEVFFLSLGGASDETARAVAERENASLGEGDEPEVSDEDLPFSLSLRQSDTLLRSSLAAESVLDTFVRKDLALTRGVRQAGFAVLKSYQVPSILVELGFVSSDRDRRALKKSSHRAALAQALAEGIDRYFEEFAPTKKNFGAR